MLQLPELKQQLTENHFITLYEIFKRHGDEQNELKTIDLFDKFRKNEFIISFSGHFSAGKSSIINYLLNKDVLPKSPIPTSANIVKITSGEGNAKVFFNNAPPVEYDEPYDIDMIKEYCMDRDTIKQIEINTKEQILPVNRAILDTPGIDAADDADRTMTESALHLVDIMYYVMDYNHVQSEINMHFLRELQSQGIPVYIIINQIDKHNENEIPFKTFRESVKQTFEQWRLRPEKIYFASVLHKQTDNNELVQMKEDLFHMLNENHEEMNRMKKAIEQMIMQHEQFLKTKTETKLIDYANEHIDHFDADVFFEIQDNLIELEQLLPHLNATFQFELNETLKNAYIMPASLRELAAAFLQSQQKDFHVGFFNRRKRTEIEKKQRLDAFLTPLLQTVESTISWHLREKFVELLEQYELDDEQLLKQVHQLSISFDEDDVLRIVHPGATFNGNYILNYTNELSGQIKTKFRREANDLWEHIKEIAKQKITKEKEQLHAALNQFNHVNKLMKKQEQFEQHERQNITHLHESYVSPHYNEQMLQQMKDTLKKRSNTTKEQTPIVNIDEENQTKRAEEPSTRPVNNTTSYRTEDVVKAIDQTLHALTNMRAFSSILRELSEKRTKLVDRNLTIALFGAFSAGKSSFSNALFGENILPVSPNPTTAVINRISPITEQYEHGTVIITCKDDETLTKDLQMITNDFSPEATNVAEFIDWIKRNNVQYDATLNNMYQAYLRALLKGYDEHYDKLGKTIEITIEEFAAYVTDEAKACYIETVDLYYDSPLTRKGITLVDTPGADSVNARHTNVSFDYIKEADAIIYVTYYNHAITSADRDFLMQLGRVKEAFELDKMFFIVNAADLAETDQELKLVVHYVEDELLRLGIRQPKIYPVSSKQSLQEKEMNHVLNDKMDSFESEFYSFIENDLASLTVESALWDIERAISTLQSFMDAAHLTGAEKEKHQLKLQQKNTQIQTIITEINVDVAKERMQERVERQLHFVIERMYIRFHDMFVQHFNPTTIKSSGRKGQTELQQCRNRFIDYIGYELLQEIRAVSLRVEAYMLTLINGIYDQIAREVRTIDDSFILPSVLEISFTTPAYDQAFDALDESVFNDVLKIFKNTKSFFEGNDRDTMKEQFYETLLPYAQNYTHEIEKQMTHAYNKQWDQKITTFITYLKDEVEQVMTENIKMMTETVDFTLLQSKYNTLQTILNTIYKDGINEK